MSARKVKELAVLAIVGMRKIWFERSSRGFEIKYDTSRVLVKWLKRHLNISGFGRRRNDLGGKGLTIMTDSD